MAFSMASRAKTLYATMMTVIILCLMLLERAMAFREKALTATMLIVVSLSLTLLPNWSMAFLILFGMIAHAVCKKESDLPESDSRRDASAGAAAQSPSVFGPGFQITSNPEPSSILLSSPRIKFDVYLNYTATDIPKSFTDCLNQALVRLGITVDKPLWPDLRETINSSRILITILSTDYASSTNRLDQLVQMWECRKLYNRTIIPIFYDISRSDVKDQVGNFGKAFRLHYKARVNSDTINTWKEVLREIAGLPGGYTRNLYKEYEGLLVQEVALRVAQIVRDDRLAITDKLVGIDLPVEKMMRKLSVAHSEGRETEVHGEDVCVIGICGAPGLGKTTLAKVIYNKVHKLFEAHSFLEGISAKGVGLSQQCLIADLLNPESAPLKSVNEGIEKIASLFTKKKVLIVLDDVDEDEQIKALVEKLTWFGLGSRIIVTTKKREVLSAFDVGAYGRGAVKEHEVEPLSEDHAEQLYCIHAFQGDAPEEVSVYDFLIKKIVRNIGTVPGHIVHHAPYFRRFLDIDSWTRTLKNLQYADKTIGAWRFERREWTH